MSNARKAGIDRSVIMKLTGHKTLSMFTRYNTVDQADAEEAMRRLESFFRQRIIRVNCIRIAASSKKGVGKNLPTP